MIPIFRHSPTDHKRKLLNTNEIMLFSDFSIEAFDPMNLACRWHYAKSSRTYMETSANELFCKSETSGDFKK